MSTIDGKNKGNLPGDEGDPGGPGDWSLYNRLYALAALRNRYYAVRHAESEANVTGMIVSHPQDALTGCGLSEKGRQQAAAAAERLAGLTGSGAVIISSDFRRARETAEIIRQGLGAVTIELSESLRERFFGNLDGQQAALYVAVGEADLRDPFHKQEGVESVIEILERTTALVADMESRHEDLDIVLVSHGDTIQILEMGFRKADPRTHRQGQLIKNAEVMPLRLGLIAL